MSAPANVRSVQAISDFRALLTTFGAEATMALEEVDMEVRRVLDWLVSERPAFWKNELRKAWDNVAEARAELERCMKKAMGDDKASCYEEKKALEKAKKYVRHCEQRMEAVKHWTRVVSHEVSEYEGRMTQLRTTLETDLSRSITVLYRMVTALESYMQLQGPGNDPLSAAMSAGGGGGGAGASARSAASGAPPDEQLALVKQLRARTPNPDSRPAIPVGTADQPAPEAGSVAGQAMLLARQLGFKLSTAPGWRDKLVAETEALTATRVYLERVETPAGDSGWHLGAVQPREKTTEYVGLRVCDLRHTHPEWLTACMLPVGALAVFEEGQLTILMDKSNKPLPFADVLASLKPAPREEPATAEQPS